jgi:hypothetical protein
MSPSDGKGTLLITLGVNGIFRLLPAMVMGPIVFSLPLPNHVDGINIAITRIPWSSENLDAIIVIHPGP